MKFDKNKLLTTVSAVALMLAVGACSSSGDDDGITAERDDALSAQKAAETAKSCCVSRSSDCGSGCDRGDERKLPLLAAQMAAETERDDALAAQTTAEAGCGYG